MFTDIHSHLIYGVDDGAHKRESMEDMLRNAAIDGIDTIISTPHMTPGQVKFDMDTYLRHMDTAREYCEKTGLKLTLYTGAEILYTPDTPRFLREKRVLTLADSRYVLIEFMPDATLRHLYDALSRVAGLGLTPIVAHVERYRSVRHVEDLSEMAEECNARFQVNARTVLTKHGFLGQRWINKLLSSGYVSYLATDTHHMPGRETCMKECYEAFSKLYGEEKAIELMRKNPAQIIEKE